MSLPYPELFPVGLFKYSWAEKGGVEHGSQYHQQIRPVIQKASLTLYSDGADLWQVNLRKSQRL